MVYLGRPYHFNFFKGCPPQILLGLFLNTLTHTTMKREKQLSYFQLNNIFSAVWESRVKQDTERLTN